MKLRRRLALAFSAATSLTLSAAFAVTLTSFKRAQERQLDHELRVHALHDADAIFRLGGRDLVLTQGLPGAPDVDGLVKYRVVYRGDGELIYSATSNPGRVPRLVELGWHPGDLLPIDSVDFKIEGQTMRGVLVRIGPLLSRPVGVLLLAAPRSDLDADTQHLEELMGAVLTVAVAASMLLAFFLGGRLTSNIDAVAGVARRVTEGQMQARVSDNAAGTDDEVRALAADLNQMIDRLSALIDAGRRFVSNAAHELRSPLAALRGELELALRHPRSAEALREAIQEALTDVNRLIGLSEDLLALARTGINKPAEPGAARLLEVVRDAVRASQPRGTEGSVARIEVDVPDVRVQGRSADLSRMVRNLLDNALDHAPADSAVRINANVKDGWAHLQVEDRGPGVPEALRERIFEPFFRGDVERERSGAGLGLAIAREIARVSGGDLMLDPAAGVTRFVVTLVALPGASPDASNPFINRTET